MTEAAGVLLHGRGGSPEEMMQLATRLAVPGLRWVAPAAPGGQWYPHRFMGPVAANEPFLTDAVAACDRAMTEASGDGRIAPERVVLVGFSQGACLASEYVLRHPARCRTLIMFTGGVLGPPGTATGTMGGPPVPASLAGLRVLITGSDADEWVPGARVRLTASVFAAHGADVTLRIYPGRAHLVCDDEIAMAQDLLQQVAG